MGRRELKVQWYEISPTCFALERKILIELPYFKLETQSFDPDDRAYRVIGRLKYHRERSGRYEEFRIALRYPRNFPRREQPVYDYEKRFALGQDGHLFAGHRLCLSLPERGEFARGSSHLTEEVLGASLVWFDKRLIYERTKKWPGNAEPHGSAAKIKLILERAGLAGIAEVEVWVKTLMTTDLRRFDVYSRCPCTSGKAFKFCHGEQLQPLVSLAGTPETKAVSDG